MSGDLEIMVSLHLSYGPTGQAPLNNRPSLSEATGARRACSSYAVSTLVIRWQFYGAGYRRIRRSARIS